MKMKNVFVWGEHSQGVVNAWNHSYVTSLALPTIQACQNEHLRHQQKSEKKTMKLIFYPQIQSQALSERLLCVRLSAMFLGF